MLGMRLSADVEERLDRLAKRTGRTKTCYARQAIIEYLDDLEGYLTGGKTSDGHSRRVNEACFHG